ncbi:hypothetical protein S245_063074, partial [Arachis hypogaea]
KTVEIDIWDVAFLLMGSENFNEIHMEYQGEGHCVVCQVLSSLVQALNLGTLWDDLGKAIEGTDEIEIGEVDCSDHQRSFVAYAYNVVSHLIKYQHCQDT